MCAFFIACLTALPAAAETDMRPSISIDARGEYQHVEQSDTTVRELNGFKAKLVSLFIQGNFAGKFSYAYRHRLNKTNFDHNFFDAADWLWLRWQATGSLSLQAGKWAVLVGAWEMDPAPVDCYQLSEFASAFPCYEWGIVGEWRTMSGNDQLMLQMCTSPFRSQLAGLTGKSIDTYAYNIAWYGKHGAWWPIWSFNLIENMPGHYITYIGLGNRFKIGCATVSIDFLNRASSHQTYLFKDCSVIARVECRPTRHVAAFAKMSYDVNRSGTAADLAVLNGTEIKRLGAGVEVFPIGDDRLRLHATYSYTWGKNASPQGELQDRQHLINCGVTWKMKLM